MTYQQYKTIQTALEVLKTAAHNRQKRGDAHSIALGVFRERQADQALRILRECFDEPVAVVLHPRMVEVAR